MCDHTNQFEDMTHMVTLSYCCVALTPTSLLPFLYYPVFCLFQVFVMYGYLGLCVSSSLNVSCHKSNVSAQVRITGSWHVALHTNDVNTYNYMLMSRACHVCLKI